MTFTLNSLADSGAGQIAGRESTAVSNLVTLAVDYLVGGILLTGTTPTANTVIELWCYAAFDGTPTYSGGATGTDNNLTPSTLGTKATMAFMIALQNLDATSNRQFNWGPFSVANLFGGSCPTAWGVYCMNNSGVALKSTGNVTTYRSVVYTNA